LGAGFEGELIGQEDTGYDEARVVFNAMIDKRPLLIARCASSEDAARAIAFAKDNDVPLAIRGGGHNGGGLGIVDDGVVADLSLMRSIPRTGRPESAAGAPGPTSTRPHRSTGWRCPAESSRPPASPA
jgi:FAD/FMN-containing dehydrogenase